MTSLAYYALWIFVFTVPWERLITLPGFSIVTRVTGALALGLTLLAIVISGRVRRWHLFHVAGLLFVIWAGVGVWALGMPNVPQKLYTFGQLFLVVWMMWELSPTIGRYRGLLAAYVLGASVPAIATILLYIRVGGALKRFSAGGDANNLAMTLALALPVAWYLSLTCKRPIVRLLFRGYLPLCVLATALTGSRGGMLTLLVALLVIPLTLTLSPGRLAATVVVLVLSGALAVAYVPEHVVARLGTTAESVQDVSLGGRFRIWTAGAHAFTRKPIMGYGVSTFKAAVTPELGPMALVAHNSFLSILVEEGLVGLALYLVMLLSVFFAVLHLPHLERRFGLVLLATLGAAMMPLTWEDSKVAWVIMAILFGLSALRVSGVRISRQPQRQGLPVGSRQRPGAVAGM